MSIEYTAHIRFDSTEVVGQLSVIIFLGNVPEDPKQWLLCSSCIGSVSQHTSQRRKPSLIEGFVNIPNDVILENSGLKDLDPVVVKPYLQTALQWRVQKNDFDCTPITLDSLQVDIIVSHILSQPDGTCISVPVDKLD